MSTSKHAPKCLWTFGVNTQEPAARHPEDCAASVEGFVAIVVYELTSKILQLKYLNGIR